MTRTLGADDEIELGGPGFCARCGVHQPADAFTIPTAPIGVCDTCHSGVVVLRNRPCNIATHFDCDLCGGYIDSGTYLFETPDGRIACDDCAETVPRHRDASPARRCWRPARTSLRGTRCAPGC